MLKIDNVWYRYQQKWILKNISFSCARGQFISILGPNGAGKTTLLCLIAGVLKPTQGQIQLGTQSLQTLSPRQRAQKIALLPQVISSIFPYKVWEIVALGRLPYLSPFQAFRRKDEMVVERAMRLVDVLSLKDRRINSLSGGERQRVFLARALAQDPEILLLDEPTTYLDVKYQKEFFQVLKRLKEEHELTIVLVSHDLNLAIQHSDTLIFIKSGQVHTQGPPEKVVQAALIEEVYGVKAKIVYPEDTARPYVLL
ncbi:MAG: ABC transporter ATP-binding protein [Candidatus Desulfofervidaceae bacterium]|nr:ABC transporter ATP-binding protein [Candidatus Desulfofervidaceae bacterium]MDL1969967.1 ABC transporter ATP-binding protein [Candidatus Desulfofervidaceae bacterium]